MLLKYLFAKKNIPAGSAAVFFGFSSIIWFMIGTGLGFLQCGKTGVSGFCHRVEMFAFGHMRQVHVLAVILDGYPWRLQWP